jgi:hypothetical protein
MNSSGSLQISGTDNILNNLTFRKLLIIATGIVILLIIIIFALSIAIFVKLNEKSNQTENDPTKPSISPTTTFQPATNQALVHSIRIEEAMSHLNQLQRIATASNGTRAINTPGFNATLDFISNYITVNTDYKITKSYFSVRDFALASNPILISSINGVTKNYTYSSDLSTVEFYHVKYSTSANFSDFVELTAIPNAGCLDDDWQKAYPPPKNRVALVERGTCLFRDKAILAAKYNVKAVLLYNDGVSPFHVSPIVFRLAQNNTVPALFLSFSVGQALAKAAQDTSQNAQVQLVIDVKDLPDFPVGNICADTPTGNLTQTIVIGSHTDSVPAGPGINDNGKVIISISLNLSHVSL